MIDWSGRWCGGWSAQVVCVQRVRVFAGGWIFSAGPVRIRSGLGWIVAARMGGERWAGEVPR